jgi:hypothetical protein
MVYPRLFNQETSEHHYEETVDVSGFPPAVEKAEGAEITYETPYFGTKRRLTHRTYTTGVRITFEAKQDDRYKIVVRFVKRQARDARRVLEIEHADVLNNGFTQLPKFQTGGVSGEYLFSTSHQLLNGDTQSNMLSAATALNETSLETLMLILDRVKGDAGQYLDLRHRRLIIPFDLRKKAFELIKSPDAPFTNENQKNYYYVQGFEIVEWVYLDSATAWFLQDPEQHGLTTLMRQETLTRYDGEINTWDDLYSTLMRFSCGWLGGWRGIGGSQGA